jgi:hypothetical protein
MKLKLFITFFALLQLISCKEENESKPEFTGITLINIIGENMGFTDTTDWRMDDKFTKLEMGLFDTLDFSQQGKMKPEFGISNKSIGIMAFCPNPTTVEGTFFIYQENIIVNLEIVDNDFNKLISYRGAEKRSISFDFHSFDPGIYRAYYVIQDLQFNIIGLGHGDIKKD